MVGVVVGWGDGGERYVWVVNEKGDRGGKGVEVENAAGEGKDRNAFTL